MQVIKHGSTYNKIECKKCKALLSYCKADIIETSIGGDYNGFVYCTKFKYIYCPECNEKIILSREEM